MSNEPEPDFLSEAELQERIKAFRVGPHTMERAAACGLLALSTPTQFGGLYVNKKRWSRMCKDEITPVTGKRNALAIHSHLWFCFLLHAKGSFAQRAMYLPSCASGKRLARWASVAIDQWERVTGGFVLNGKIPVPRGDFEYVLVSVIYPLAFIDGVFVEHDPHGHRLLLSVGSISRLRNHPILTSLYFDDVFVPDNAELKRLRQAVDQTERWNTTGRVHNDQSA